MATASRIRSVGSYLPETVYTNEDLAKMMDTSHAWIVERSGIEQRHIADLNQSTSDLGVEAARVALERAELDPQDVDLIVAGTLSPDHYFPGIGVLIQDKLGCRNVGALDIRGQCSGFSWGLATADAFIRSGSYRNILVVGAEVHSRVIEFSNRGRNVSVLFGDGAGAVVVQAADEQDVPRADNSVRGIIDSHMGSDGSGAPQLLIERPGTGAGHERFVTSTEAEDGACLPYMEGRQVFKHAVARMLEAGHHLLRKHGLTPGDLDLLIPHQANLRINEMVRHKLELPEEKVVNNIQRYGNTTAATLPLCMDDAAKDGRLHEGTLLLTVAFGSGFTWGANLLRW